MLRNRVLVSVAGAVDHVTNYTYDGLGRLARVQQSGPRATGKRADFGFSDANRLVEIRRYADLAATKLAVQSSYEFDGQGHVVQLEHSQRDNLLASYHWTLDVNGQVVREDASQDGRVYYRYDAAGGNWSPPTTTTSPTSPLSTMQTGTEPRASLRWVIAIRSCRMVNMTTNTMLKEIERGDWNSRPAGSRGIHGTR